MTDTAIICIGTELLEGRIDELNARYLGEVSTRTDLQLSEIRVVADDPTRIRRALEETADRQLVVVSGGLGPTDDDITRRAAADFADTSLREDTESLRRLERRFDRRNANVTPNNLRQCRFPVGADILVSQVGTADGFHLRHRDTDYFFFPGVPPEFRWFVDRHLPVDDQSPDYRSDLVLFGRGESDFETMLGDLPDRARDRNVQIRFRATFPLIELTVSGPPKAARDIEADIRDEVGPWLVADGDQSMAGRLGERLAEAGATVSVAESCTAGLVAARLTSVSGSSRYFGQGYLTYSNDAKVQLLDVDDRLIEDHGAVSPQVCTQMATGARDRSGADFALAVSGIAGPTGGTPAKPVGTVDFALAAPEGVYHLRRHFTDRSRREVRILSVYTAVAGLLWRLEDRLDDHSWRGPVDVDDVRAGLQLPD